jgi:hypothetical protein
LKTTTEGRGLRDATVLDLAAEILPFHGIRPGYGVAKPFAELILSYKGELSSNPFGKVWEYVVPGKNDFTLCVHISNAMCDT